MLNSEIELLLFENLFDMKLLKEKFADALQKYVYSKRDRFDAVKYQQDENSLNKGNTYIDFNKRWATFNITSNHHYERFDSDYYYYNISDIIDSYATVRDKKEIIEEFDDFVDFVYMNMFLSSLYEFFSYSALRKISNAVEYVNLISFIVKNYPDRIKAGILDNADIDNILSEIINYSILNNDILFFLDLLTKFKIYKNTDNKIIDFFKKVYSKDKDKIKEKATNYVLKQEIDIDIIDSGKPIGIIEDGALWGTYIFYLKVPVNKNSRQDINEILRGVIQDKVNRSETIYISEDPYLEFYYK